MHTDVLLRLDVGVKKGRKDRGQEEESIIVDMIKGESDRWEGVEWG